MHSMLRVMYLHPLSLTLILTLTLPLCQNKGSRLTKSSKLLGYILAQYIDGDEKSPTRTECVDLYIEDAISKHRAYLHRQEKA